MRICDLSSGLGHLERVSAQLKDRWRDTQEHWDDTARSQFEAEHLRPLEPPIKLTVAYVQRFAELLERARRECRDDDRAEHENRL